MTYFFPCTEASQQEITNLYDFVWPTAVALWNLRWQVHGYTTIYTNSTDKDLHSRFVLGSNIRGVNLKKACINCTWEEQKTFFSSFLLTQLFTIYEGWIKEALECLGSHSKRKADDLQFPERYSNTLSVIQQTESTTISTVFYPSLQKNKKYGLNYFQNWLFCYRYFKEARNCIIHNGGNADSRSVDAWRSFSAIANKNDLNLKEVPKHFEFINGQKVILDLRGVVGLSDVILRMIVTLDAELAKARGAERILLAKWKKVHKKKTMPADERCKHQRLKYMARNALLPEPHDVAELSNFLNQHSLIEFG